ncbi:hypothetical protein HUJ05_011802 [Dendroctonus ponderosae]|nr:hypothetical protein HUJ05_011802 [Dendroctonus ponderosae]
MIAKSGYSPDEPNDHESQQQKKSRIMVQGLSQYQMRTKQSRTPVENPLPSPSRLICDVLLTPSLLNLVTFS